MLADDLPPPEYVDLCASLATDDVMLFSRGGGPRAREAIGQIDNAIANLGIQPHRGKDVNEELNCMLIGVDLVDGQRLAPHADKAALVFRGIVYLLCCGNLDLTSLELHAFLGHIA